MKRNIIISFLLVTLTIFSGISTNHSSDFFFSADKDNPTIQDSILNFGLSFLRTPYSYGSTGPNSFDCSGFTSYVFKQFGFNLSRDSRQQAKQTTTIKKEDLQKGDLVFFEGRRRNGVVGHVGIVLEKKENGEFNFLHASVNQGVTITSSDQAYYVARYVKGGRIIPGVYISENNNTAQNKGQSETKSNSCENDNLSDFHIVKRGESLKEIAEKYDIPITTLKQLNGLKSSRIKKGMKLRISEGNEDVLGITSKQEPVFQSDTILNNEVVTIKQPEVIAENAYSKHKVGKGETLFSIAKANNLTINELKKLNNLNSEKLSIGQTLNVGKTDTEITNSVSIPAVNEEQNMTETDSKPTEKAMTQNKTAVTTNRKKPDTNADNTAKHTVQKGETLYDIAKKNNLTVEELKQFNELSSDKLVTGQVIFVKKTEKNEQTKQNLSEKRSKEKQRSGITKHVVKKGETLFSIRRKYGCKLDDLKKWNNLSGDIPLQVGQKLVIYQ